MLSDSTPHTHTLTHKKRERERDLCSLIDFVSPFKAPMQNERKCKSRAPLGSKQSVFLAQVFRCPSLERRLAGLMHICGLVALAEQREAGMATNGSLFPPGEGRDTAWVTSRTMEEWLVEIRFLEELFGSSMHVELVSA